MMKEKEKRITITSYLKQFYRGNHGRLVIAMIPTLLITAGNLLISWLLQQILDLVAGVEIGFDFQELIAMAALSAVIVVLGFLFAYVSKPRFIAKGMTQYKEHVFEQLSKKSISAFSGENSSLYISALSNDAATIESNYLCNIFLIADQAVLFVGALVMMLLYHPLLTVISILFSLFPVVVTVLVGNRIAEAEKQVSDCNEKYMSVLQDSLAGFSVVKSFRAELQVCRNFAASVRVVASVQEKRRKITIVVQMLSALASVVVQLGVFLVGGYLALSGRGVTVGVVLVFVQLLNYVLSPISAIPQYLAECKAAKALIQKLADALSDNVREEGETDKRELTDGICLENLSFAYEEDKNVLSNINFTFEAGKSYALVGASGSGKSTLLNLMMAAHPEYQGEICYDDTELREIRSEALYEMVSVIQQNVFVFNASIWDNITMFSEFPLEEVERAITLSGLSQLIAERGEEYLCGESGSGLSGGEKQRISIARSLLKKSQVLLVDEATAALDAQTAYQVFQAILQLQDITRIVVTHALDENLLKQYDCILTLKNGVIAEAGSFEELMQRKEYFYSLFTVSQ